MVGISVAVITEDRRVIASQIRRNVRISLECARQMMDNVGQQNFKISSL